MDFYTIATAVSHSANWGAYGAIAAIVSTALVAGTVVAGLVGRYMTKWRKKENERETLNDIVNKFPVVTQEVRDLHETVEDHINNQSIHVRPRTAR